MAYRTTHRIARGNVPGHKDRDLRHDRISEAERRGEMGELLDRVSHEAGVLEPGHAIGARANVRLERSNAKTLLVIEEEVDLGREKVTMIHGEVYALVRRWVSVETEEIFGVQSGLESAVRRLTKDGIGNLARKHPFDRR